MRYCFPFIFLAWCVAFGFLSDTYAQRPQLVIQTGHADEVRAVAFTPDNRILASGSADNTVKLWDVATGTELGTLKGHSGGVYSVAFSPDGNILATAGADRTIRLWSVDSGNELRTMTAESGVLVSVVFSPDGKTLASASLNRNVDLWDVATGQLLRTLKGHSSEVISVAFSPNGKFLASGGNDQVVKLWDIVTGKEIRSLQGHTGEVYTVVFSPDGKILASGSADQTIVLWSILDGKELRRFHGHTGLVKSVGFSPDGDTLISGSTDDTIRLWKVNTGAETLKLDGASGIAAIAVGPDGKTVASGNRDQTVTLWDVSTGTLLRTLKGQSVVVNSIAFSADNRILAIGNRNATIKLLSITSGTELRTLEERSGTVLSTAFSPDGQVLASGNSDQAIRLWNVKSGALVATLVGHLGLIRSVAFNPDGKLLASGSSDKTIKMWDVSSGRELRSLVGHTGSVNSVAFSPDGKMLATAGADKTIRIWDVATGTERMVLRGHHDTVTCIAFSPDGKAIASGSADSTIKLWDSKTGQLMHSFAGHSGSVSTVAFSPDAKVVASGSLDQTVRLWDVAAKGESRTLTGHRGAVYTVAFSADGRILASGGRDAVTRLWDMSTAQELASLLASDPGNWLIATPDSLFDGSPASWREIHWSFGKSVLDYAPLNAFFSEFYYPGLLAEIFAGKHPRASVELSQKDRRQPQLKLTLAEGQTGSSLTTRNVTVKVEVSHAPAGAQDVRLFRNGSLVKVWHGDVLKGQSNVTLEVKIPIVAGENHLTAYAFNHDNIKSNDASLLVTGDNSLKRSGTFYVLAIGITEYSNPEYNLSYAALDAQALSAELQKQQQELGIYGSVKIIPLLDREATKANILQTLFQLADKAQPEDAVIVYFSGHGMAQRQHYYLIPFDLGYQGPRTKLSAADLKTILEHSISDIELEEAFRPIDAGHLLLVLDAANSGQALEAEEKRRGPMNSKGLAQLAYEKGMYILAGAQSYQDATESARFQHGLLTFGLLEGLTTAAADLDRDGQITAHEWLNYAAERVPQLVLSPMQEKNHPTALRFSQYMVQDTGPEGRKVQRPRVFYRRELETKPLIIARTN